MSNAIESKESSRCGVGGAIKSPKMQQNSLSASDEPKKKCIQKKKCSAGCVTKSYRKLHAFPSAVWEPKRVAEMSFCADSKDSKCNSVSDIGSSDEEDVASPMKVEEIYQYSVLKLGQVAEVQLNIIGEVRSVVQLSSPIVRILLSHFKWDKSKLLDKYYESEPEKFFREAHVMNPFETPQISSYAEACEICLSVLPRDSGTGLECGHRFCLSCWRKYLTQKIIGEGAAQSICCPAHGCDNLVDNATVIRLVPELQLKYQQLMINSFVEGNELLRWCPSVDCQYVIMVSEREPRPVRCKCGHVFCFFCGEGWHEPVKCGWLQKWNKICEEDAVTSNWIAANKMDCPRCHVTIEKDRGGNRVKCKNPSCQYDFCWVCLGPWEPHGTSLYSCNRVDNAAAQEAGDERDKQRAKASEYLHYYKRYVNHRHSLKLENKLYTMTREKMEELQLYNMSWTDVQCLKEAVDVLCQCRHTLMYTYVFVFFVEKNHQLEILEGNQKILELATEALSEYMQHDITSEYLVDLSEQIQNKYRYCQGRRKALLSHVHEGYEKGWWNHVEWRQ